LSTNLFLLSTTKKRFQHQQEVVELRESFSRTILQSKLEIQEHTLDHIAKELHANLSHLVSLININLSAILVQSSPDARQQVSETKALVKELMNEVKKLSVSLNSEHIMQAGFVRKLENELERLTKTKRYQVNYNKKGEIIRLPSGEEIVLYRLCQEILNNIVKHSGATEINVNLLFTDENISLQIADNGNGFDTALAASQAMEKESTGLLNIVGRAKQINAELQIHSIPGTGTTVNLAIPLNRKKYELS
jgi:signal transduction histidine kinase